MTQSLIVRMAKVESDRALQAGARGARKLAVTHMYAPDEIPVRDSEWQPPAADQPCPVLTLPATEMAVFNEHARQERHYHLRATEIYVVMAGTMDIEIEGTTHRLAAGDSAIVVPGAAHEVKKQGLKFTSYVISADCGGPGDKYPA